MRNICQSIAALITGTFLGTIAIASTPKMAQAITLTDGIPYFQNFDTLASSGTTNTALPADWFFTELGTNANTTYAADAGGLNTGNTYSYGFAGSSEHALGSLTSSNLTPIYLGASFTISSSALVDSLDISYRGEQWRTGRRAEPDRLDFQYSLDATSLTTGTWLDWNPLDHVSLVTTGALETQSNASINLNSTITGLNLGNGSTLWIRWRDTDIASTDDGLAIDDFSITARTVVPTPALLPGLVGFGLAALRKRKTA